MRHLAILMIVLLVCGCGAADELAESGMEETISLPAPAGRSAISLEEAIAERRSVRDFLPTSLEMSELSQLLWSAQGVTSPGGKRAAPSAGALYPLEIYVITPSGLFRYVPDDHSLLQLGRSDVREPLAAAALGQEAVRDGAAVFVITGVFARTAVKYGDRADRYVVLEAGHAAQNLLLQATAMGLGAVPIGAFDDADVQAVLGLPRDHEPLYVIPVGHPPSTTGR